MLGAPTKVLAGRLLRSVEMSVVMMMIMMVAGGRKGQV